MRRIMRILAVALFGFALFRILAHVNRLDELSEYGNGYMVGNGILLLISILILWLSFRKAK